MGHWVMGHGQLRIKGEANMGVSRGPSLRGPIQSYNVRIEEFVAFCILFETQTRISIVN